MPAGGAKPNVGLLLNFNQERRGGLAVELLLVMEKKEGRSYQRIPLAGSHKAYLEGLPVPLAQVVRKLADEALVEHLVRNGFAWIRDADKPFELLDERHYVLLRQWISEVLQELKPLAPPSLVTLWCGAGTLSSLPRRVTKIIWPESRASAR